MSQLPKRPLRVAFHLIGGEKWRGGARYQLNLLRSIRQYVPDRITCVLVCGQHANQKQVEELAPFLEEAPVISSVAQHLKSLRHQFPRAIGLESKKGFSHFRDQYKIDVVFENAVLWGSKLPCAAIGWLPDFQHRKLKHYFSFSERLKREIGFLTQIKYDRTIMLSSKSAADDFRELYPRAKNNLCVVPFAVPFERPLDEPTVTQTRLKYGLRDKYIILPNQFWPHKNHALVVEALSILKQSNAEDITIVMTGNTKDQTGNTTYDNVLRLVAQRGLERQCFVLGEIPYLDLQALMQGAVALLNPSQFEGWSTTVEEAKAVSLPMILSDISTHREQAPDAYFFPIQSPQALAKLLIELFQVLQPGADRVLDIQLAQKAAENRQLVFAEAVASCVESAYLNNPNNRA